jgi:hypothetical protein
MASLAPLAALLPAAALHAVHMGLAIMLYGGDGDIARRVDSLHFAPSSSGSARSRPAKAALFSGVSGAQERPEKCPLSGQEADVNCPVHGGAVHSSVLLRTTGAPGLAAPPAGSAPLLWGRVKAAHACGEANAPLGQSLLGEALDFRASPTDGAVAGACVLCATWHAAFSAGALRALCGSFLALALACVADSAVVPAVAPQLSVEERAYIAAAGSYGAVLLASASLLSHARGVAAWATAARDAGVRVRSRLLRRVPTAALRLLAAGRLLRPEAPPARLLALKPELTPFDANAAFGEGAHLAATDGVDRGVRPAAGDGLRARLLRAAEAPARFMKDI